MTARCISATPQWWKEKVEIVTGQIAMIALTWLAGKSFKFGPWTRHVSLPKGTGSTDIFGQDSLTKPLPFGVSSTGGFDQGFAPKRSPQGRVHYFYLPKLHAQIFRGNP